VRSVLAKVRSRRGTAAFGAALVITTVVVATAAAQDDAAPDTAPASLISDSEIGADEPRPHAFMTETTGNSDSAQTPSPTPQASAPGAPEEPNGQSGQNDGVSTAGPDSRSTPAPPVDWSRPTAGEPTTLLTEGNFKSYRDAPFSAYTGMWGLRRSDALVADSSMRVTPSTFPHGTVFTWDVTPDPEADGVNGYLHVAYGNYDHSPGTITPRRVRDITDLTVDIGWAFHGDEASGLLVECWLSPDAAPSGTFPKLHEIGFLPKTSPPAQAWLARLPAVGTGSFVDSNGITWNVRESGTYRVAYRPGYADFQGRLPFHEFFAFLVTSGEITGNEWFNGVAFGVEPLSGAGSLTITKFAPSYAGT
jgi:hypothetical protein